MLYQESKKIEEILGRFNGKMSAIFEMNLENHQDLNTDEYDTSKNKTE
jgi:hypothetical protein